MTVTTTRFPIATDVLHCLDTLAAAGFACALFGGWAEQAQNMIRQRPHKDIDLLLLASDFGKLDAFIKAQPDVAEIQAKRFPHKRAFSMCEIMIEVFLVSQKEGRYVTYFWGDTVYDWDVPLTQTVPWLGQAHAMVTTANLNRYRARHADLQPHRWRDFALSESSRD